MSSLIVKWTASQKLLAAELVASGKIGKARRETALDLATITPAEREALLALTPLQVNGVGDVSLPAIKVDEYARLEGEHWSASPIHFEPFPLDQEPNTPALVLAAVARRNALEEPARAWQAQEAAAKKAEAVAKKADYDRHLAEYRRMRPLLTALIDAGERETVQANVFTGSLACPAWYKKDWRPEWHDIKGQYPNYSTLAEIRDTALEMWRKADAELRQKQEEAGKRAWVAAHGSAHLKRACQDYDCQRLYVIERAALEAPGFVVDFDDAAAWKDRSCPSMAALDAEEAARQLGLGEPLIVWLTRPPQAEKPAMVDPDDYLSEDEVDREAVVLRRYLGRYDLVQTL